jgi:hypothetical protein
LFVGFFVSVTHTGSHLKGQQTFAWKAGAGQSAVKVTAIVMLARNAQQCDYQVIEKTVCFIVVCCACLYVFL